MIRRPRSDRGSVVWWAVAVVGCALVMLSGLVLVAQGSVRAAQAQAVADLAALAAVGVDESGSPSAGAMAEVISARNGCSLRSANPQPTVSGGRRWRVWVAKGPIEATAAAEPEPVHASGSTSP
ncbi:MAG: hypothetical protein WAX12_05880 [Candidatus Microthrix subdominans]|uniref:hypothetical protein n=1 Tax=Candidatus Neomicrothrix sp. TaxID=2719034 RepID=UPI001B557E9B|nr:hypothetical protein [Candidatus Microthrix sp.]MBK6971230.1 hypothetical protein [Candidatus Microthrix sp.]MBK7164061.1 hypothetical protein [Candidatus Microthrix sp.]MBK9559011.1 hypothetical protein [Candidatus Microthrix sp.]MBP7594656.1 hypothetical protein [Candidatus Microthrix sp.]MBP9065332.1 hypothetical protein [Candidatus Microthrix sp.]